MRLPCPRAFASFTAVTNGEGAKGAKLVLFGGIGIKRNELELARQVAYLDWDQKQWHFPDASGNPHSSLELPSSAAVGKSLIMFGGRTPNRATAQLSVLHTGHWRWSQPQITGVLPEPRFAAAMTFDGEEMIVFGGLRQRPRKVWKRNDYLGDLHSIRISLAHAAP